ncbi:ABC transporter-like protein [Planococcus antarcticus DSM 14505]|uniref:ABC transporter-like protein n=1 Tax=Planococcus antarcticus DSM 14505 TaxID=1185653 RepID=A0AA87INX6_9BACL|nr:ABC transporter ATP-binding protein [Planococcus antarcticus]EIM08016.1 ABC transporter-like protein [Planococcus antarcticus DSM 14505]
MNTSISINNLNKNYGKTAVLDRVNLQIAGGEIFGLIGPSGSGKTTLVKMIVGIDSPSAGTVDVLGKRVPNLTLLQDIGYMAQSDALYPELTGKENLRFFASLYNMKKSKLKERIAYAADLVQLTGELGKKVSAYSGGMKRRLSLAIALVHDPHILILDEPTVGIDPELRLSIWSELMLLKREHGKTIIVTTHVMDEAEKCDRIAMVREGGILAAGTPGELKAAYGATDLEGVFLQAGRDAR